MKRILGLDLGTNSIGWAVVEIDHDNKIVRIIALGSRIIPMGDKEISTFENGGKLKSSAANRTEDKSIRKNKARFLLRRDRLHCVLNLLQWLPEHYKLDIEFVDEKGKRSGKIIKGKEPKLAYDIDDNGKGIFIFRDAYAEMEQEFKSVHPELFYNKGKSKHNKGKSEKLTKIPYDWTLYYLRKKGLSQELTKEELAWVTMSFLQKRGYEKVMGKDEKEQKEGEISEIINAKVVSVEPLSEKTPNGLSIYHIKLADEYKNIIFEYDEAANYQITQLNEFKLLEKISKLSKENDDIAKAKVEIRISEIKNIEITDIINTHQKRKENTIFIYNLATGWTPEFQSRYAPKLKGTHRDFVIVSTYDQAGVLTKKRNIKMPNEDSALLTKLKTETSIQEYNSINKTVGVGSYIYDTLLRNPNQKIKAGLVETVERDFYENELRAILNAQKQFHPELQDNQRYMDALMMLYPNNESHRNSLSQRDFTALLADDIIFYQRDLKTKKSQIADCRYEYVTFKKDGKEEKKPLKGIAKSNPLYQEFRLWQFIKRLRIIKLESENEQGEKLVNIDVSDKHLTLLTKEVLFEWLNNKKEVTQAAVLRKLGLDESNYVWNYESDHKEPCNETRYEFVLRLKRIKGFDWNTFLNAKSKVHVPKKKNSADGIVDGPSNEYLLWHFFYSVKKKSDRLKGLPSLIEKLLNNADIDLSHKNKVIEMLSSISTYKSEYGTYSEKAIKKLLPFMRLGKYWKQEDVERIKTIYPIKPEVLAKENIQGEITDLQGLWVSSACYVVYGRYSESSDETHWTQPSQLKDYLLSKEFKHNSINNPVVEKVLRETLMVVHDIWTTFGEEEGTTTEDGTSVKAYKKYFDQINIEIGTSLKKNSKQKDLDSKKNAENRRANERARAMLKELKAKYRDKIKDESPFQLLKMRLLESGAIEAIKYDKDDTTYEFKENTDEKTFTKKELSELLKKEVSTISANEILRYRLWLEQRYISPYTGVPICLSKLFDPEEYQVDHIFPQERITFDSMTNKVLCEAWVNQAKGAKTGYEFILDCKGKVRYSGNVKAVLTPEDYVNHINTTIFNPEKKEILLSKTIPNKFGNNQLNNTRYIAKLAMELLSNVVREEGEKEFKSKNLLVISGGITSRLKKDWQLDDAWNELIKPRFVHLNQLLETEEFISSRKINGHDVEIPVIPTEKITIYGELTNNQPKDVIPFDVSKKRIDHRHHALDALIVALATSNHVNYINNQTGSDLDINSNQRIDERKDLKAKYMTTKLREDGTKRKFFLPPMQYKERGKTVFYKYTYKNLAPQSVFKDVVILALQNTLATFKQKNHIMRQRTNWITHPDYKNGLREKDLEQKKKYSVRQSLHEKTFYGKRLFRPMPIENAINKSELIVGNRIRHQIQALSQEGLSKDQIIQKLKCTDPIVYIKEECAVTQWNECHSISILAKSDKSKIIKEIECAVDICVQNILKRHLAKYDSVKLTVSEAAFYYDDIVYEEQKAIVDDYLNSRKESDKLIDVFVRNKEFGDKSLVHNPQLAFSTDGIEDMNYHITELNNGKCHKPIYRVKFAQTLGKMFPLAEQEDGKPITVKSKQFVCTDKGSNIVCGIYKSGKSNTKIFAPSLRDVIDAVRTGKVLFPETYPDPKFFDFKFKFTLSPLDMVYMPTKGEIENNCLNDCIDFSRVFIMNNVDDNHVYFRPYNVAAEIIKNELDLQKDEKGKLIGSRDCKTANCDGFTIKDYCIPIKVDRLGNIIKVG